MLYKLKQRFHREAFLTTYLSIIMNPVYIIRRGLFKSISEVAPLIEGSILDFGCGSKPYESLFTNAQSYLGIDIEVSGHNHRHSKIDFFYDGKSLPFPDEYFDAVVAFEVFEHVFNIEEVLAEIQRVLKPQGQLFISIPFAWGEHEIPYDFARYTSYGIQHIFLKNGYTIVSLKKTTTYILAIGQMFISYLTQYVLPGGKVLGKLSQLTIIFPLTVAILLLDMLLPKRYDYFCNTMVLARKKTVNLRQYKNKIEVD